MSTNKFHILFGFRFRPIGDNAADLPKGQVHLPPG